MHDRFVWVVIRNGKGIDRISGSACGLTKLTGNFQNFIPTLLKFPLAFQMCDGMGFIGMGRFLGNTNDEVSLFLYAFCDNFAVLPPDVFNSIGFNKTYLDGFIGKLARKGYFFGLV